MPELLKAAVAESEAQAKVEDIDTLFGPLDIDGQRCDVVRMTVGKAKPKKVTFLRVGQQRIPLGTAYKTIEALQAHEAEQAKSKPAAKPATK